MNSIKIRIVEEIKPVLFLHFIDTINYFRIILINQSESHDSICKAFENRQFKSLIPKVEEFTRWSLCKRETLGFVFYLKRFKTLIFDLCYSFNKILAVGIGL